jgi:hypothetical protein
MGLLSSPVMRRVIGEFDGGSKLLPFAIEVQEVKKVCGGRRLRLNLSTNLMICR